MMCGADDAATSTSQIEADLRAAFARDAQAAIRYLFAAQEADVEGAPDAAAAFRTVADNEIGRAFGHLEFLVDVDESALGRPADSAMDRLELAIAEEIHECRNLYPSFADRADAAGEREIAEWFRSLSRPEASPAGRFQQVLDDLD